MRAFLICALLVPSAAFAAERKRLAILPSIVGESNDLTRSDVIEALAKALELRASLDLVTASELLTGTAEPVLTAAERCGADLACIRDRVGPSGIDLALRVVVNRAVEPALISLHLVDVVSATIVREAFGEGGADPNADLLVLAAQLFDRAGHREGARVRISLSPPDAELSFPGAVRIGADLFLVEPGRHQIEARHEGFDPASHVVVAERGATFEVSLALVPQDTSSVVSSPWLWIGVGAGAIAIAAVVTLVVVDPWRPDCLCVGAPGGPPCAC
jgi:hypothetical protein